MGEKRVTDPKTLMFMKFFEKKYGVKFVDADTGKIVKSTGEYDDEEGTV